MGNLKDTASMTVTLNGEQAERELQTLQGHMKKLIELRDKAMAAGDVTGYNKLNAEIKKSTSEAKRLEQQMLGVDKVMKNLSGSSLKELKEAQSLLERQVTTWKRGTAEHTIALGKLKQVNGEISSIRKEMYATSTGSQKLGAGFQNLLSSAKSLLPAFGFGAIVAGASAAFNKVVNATENLSKKWEAFTGGLKNGMDQFWRTLATGDFTNFIGRMKEAISVGAEYQRMLEGVREGTRALSIIEAKAREKALDLEEAAKNKNLSTAERKKASTDRIQLEDELAEKRVKVAQDAYDAEMKLTMQQTNLSKESLETVIQDLDSETKARADAYNQQADDYNKARKKNEITQIVPGGASTTIQLPDTEEMKALKSVIDATAQSVVNYAKVISKSGDTTEVQLDKLAAAQVSLIGAGVSAKENTRRIRTTMHTLEAKEDQEEEKSGKKAVQTTKDQLDQQLKDLDEAYQGRLLIIEQQHLKEQDSDANFKLKMSIAEQDYLEQKMSIIQEAGQSTLDIQRKLLEDDLALMKSMNEQMADSDEEFWKTFNAQREAEANAEKENTDKSVNDNINLGESLRQELDFGIGDEDTLEGIQSSENAQLAELEKIRAKGLITEKKYEEEVTRVKEEAEDKRYSFVKNRINATQQLLSVASSFLSASMENELAKAGDNEEKKDAIRKKYAKKQQAVQIAQAIADGAMAVMSILQGKITGNPLIDTILKAVLIASTVATTALQISTIRSQKFSEGGYTGNGGIYEPAGIVHKGEYVIPAAGMQNKQVVPFVDIIETARRNDKLSTLDMGSIMRATAARNYSSGGYVSSAPQVTTVSGRNIGVSNDPEATAVLQRMTAALEENTKATQLLMTWKPKVFTEMIRKDLNTLDAIEKNRNL